MNTMLPSLDRRLAALLDLKRKIETEFENSVHQGKVITLSREFGCEAYPLASRLKEKLEELTCLKWTVFKEGAIESTSSESILSANLKEDFGEQSRYLEAIIASLIPNWTTESEYYKEVVKTIVAIAHRGNAILIGRGASTITMNLPNCYHFRLTGSRSFRARSYAERHGLSVIKAEKIVEERERHRKEFLKRFLGKSFDPNDFHLILNNEKMPIDRIVDIITSYVLDLH